MFLCGVIVQRVSKSDTEQQQQQQQSHTDSRENEKTHEVGREAGGRYHQRTDGRSAQETSRSALSLDVHRPLLLLSATFESPDDGQMAATENRV